MATLNVRTQGLDRSDLALAFKDFRVLKAFENMVTDVSVTIPGAIDDQETAIAAAQAAADAAQSAADTAQATADSAALAATAAQDDVNALETLITPLPLTDAVSIAVPAADNWSFSVTLGGNRTLAAPTGLVDGARLAFVIHQDGTGGRTLAFNAIYDFGAAGAPTLSTTAGAADLVIGYYDATAGKILCIFRRQDAVASTAAYFSAHNNGTLQAIPNGAFTKLTFGTEVYDVGSKFASSSWTPPARLVEMHGAVCVSSAAGALVTLAVYKNGVEFKRGVMQQPQGSSAIVCTVHCQDVATGTDVYDLWAFQSSGASQNTNGGANLTWFQGSTLTP